MVNTATTRDQYSGLNFSGESTTMNRCGVVGCIEGSERDISIICGVVVLVAVVESV